MRKFFMMVAVAMMALMSAYAQTGVYVRTEAALNNAITTYPEGLVVLSADITLSNYVGIRAGNKITIDLNGHTLRRNLNATERDGHVIEIFGGGTLILQDNAGGGKISGGRAVNGGGICNYGTLFFYGGTITDCNASEQGGGIKNNTGCNVLMAGGTINACWSPQGGGICNNGGTFIIINSTISGNSADVITLSEANGGGRGGAIWNNGTLSMGESTITNNRAYYAGGGVFCSSGTTSMDSETAITNNAAPDAGGIYVDGSATANLTGATITGNKSEEHGGGGITNYGTLTVNDGTIITDNQCLTNGGGIWSYGTVNMQGTVTVKANKRTGSANISTYGPNTNVYLGDGCVINVVGNLNDSEIGVYKESIPSAVTANLGTYGNVSCFASDNISGAHLTLDGGEVVLASWSGADTWTDAGNYSENFSHVEPIASSSQKRVYIESEEELALLAHKINTGENLYYKYEFHLNRDLNMEAHLWTPMGTTDHPAEVLFYGHGHTIAGIRVERPSEDYNGLFGYMDEGNITNIVLTNSYINGRNYTGSVLGGFYDNYYGYKLDNLVSDAVVKGVDYVGGIAGDTENMNVTNCLYMGNSVTGSSNVGAVFGSNLSGSSKTYNNYYTETGSYISGVDVRAYPVCVGTNPDGVTVSSISTNLGVSYGGTYYVPSGATLTVKAQYEKGIDKIISGISVNSTALTDNGDGSFSGNISADGSTTQFTIVVTLTDTGITGDGTEASPYIIATQGQWNTVATAVVKGNTFSNKCLQLAADIQAGSQIGTQSHPFKGVFDGDGHQLSVFYTATGDYCAPFQYVDGATIKNLRLAGTIYPCKTSCAASIIGHSEGNTNLLACSSSVDLFTNDADNPRFAGLVGLVQSGSLTIEGCVFNGGLLGQSNLLISPPTAISGFVALAKGNVPVSISNSFLAWSRFNGPGSKTFVDYAGNGAFITISNSYYINSIGTPQGKQGYSHTAPSAVFGELLATYAASGITAYENGLGYNGYYYNEYPLVTLNDQNDNSGIISEQNGKTVDVSISRRTLYKDGSWNTLCLPFALNSLIGTPLEDATVKTLESVTFVNGTLTLNFSDVVGGEAQSPTIEAGKPYIVKWDGDGSSNILEPVFEAVTITSTEPTDVTGTAANFHGVYSPYSAGDNDKIILYLGDDNMLYYPHADMTIGAFRAFFHAISRLGDANGDNQVNVTDVTMMVDHILGIDGEGFIIGNADVNGDGDINVTDVTALVNLILGGNSGFNVVVNGADGITFGGGGNGPARSNQFNPKEDMKKNKH